MEVFQATYGGNYLLFIVLLIIVSIWVKFVRDTESLLGGQEYKNCNIVYVVTLNKFNSFHAN